MKYCIKRNNSNRWISATRRCGTIDKIFKDFHQAGIKNLVKTRFCMRSITTSTDDIPSSSKSIQSGFSIIGIHSIPFKSNSISSSYTISVSDFLRGRWCRIVAKKRPAISIQMHRWLESTKIFFLPGNVFVFVSRKTCTLLTFSHFNYISGI